MTRHADVLVLARVEALIMVIKSTADVAVVSVRPFP